MSFNRSFRFANRLWHTGGRSLEKRHLAMAVAAVFVGYNGTGRTALAEPKFDPSRSQVYSWGSAQYYQTGTGGAKNISTPEEVAHLSSKRVVKVAAGGQQSMVLTEAGVVYTFGRGENFRMGHGANTNESYPRPVLSLPKCVSISCGERHLAAVASDGSLYTWGKGTSGQLGHKASKLPEKVESLAGEKIVEVSCGTVHTLARTADGRVFATGTAKSGALGTGNRKNLTEFTQIEALKDQKIVKIAAGEDFSLFLTENGDVFSCGASDFGQSGLGQAERYVRTPTLLTSFTDKKVVSIAAGSLHAALVTSDGALYTWGENKRGQLGHGDTFHRWTPHRVESLEDVHVRSASCGSHHTAVLADPSNTVYIFGDGRSGQLGRGDHVESVAAFRDRPVELTSFTKSNCTVHELALGSDHSVALCTDED